MEDLFNDPPPAKPSDASPAEEEYESVLFVARESYVYRLPGGTASNRAANWGDMMAFLWKGRCRVMELSRGTQSRVIVKLEDSNSGELFAQCPYDDTGRSVEPVLDSSRYFILKVVDVNTGKHAFLGMGFQDRTEAFDFQVALQDWQKRQRVPKDGADAQSSSSPSNATATAPKRDFSLKEGETISVRLGSQAATKKTTKSSDNSGGGAIPLLAPPPGVTRKR